MLCKPRRKRLRNGSRTQYPRRRDTGASGLPTRPPHCPVMMSSIYACSPPNLVRSCHSSSLHPRTGIPWWRTRCLSWILLAVVETTLRGCRVLVWRPGHYTGPDPSWSYRSWVSTETQSQAHRQGWYTCSPWPLCQHTDDDGLAYHRHIVQF